MQAFKENLEKMAGEKGIKIISKKELVQLFSDISQTTIQRTLNDLVKDGRVLKIGGGRYTKYKWNWEDEE